MTQEHPITPPQELVQQWYDNMGPDPGPFESFAIAAARWGADQQLELDAKWLDHNALNEAHLKITPMGEVLKEAMRPKPPSLKENAIKALNSFECFIWCVDDIDIIRRALEALDD